MDKEEKPRKLTLKLNRPISADKLNLISKGDASKIEATPNLSKIEGGKLTAEELNKRLGIAKKAASDASKKIEEKVAFEEVAKASKIDTQEDGFSQKGSQQVNQVSEEEKIEEDAVEKIEIQEVKNEPKILLSKKTEQEVLPLKKIEPVIKDFTKKKTVEEEKVVPKKQKTDSKKLKRNDIYNLLDEDEEDVSVKRRSLASIKRSRAKEKRKQEPQEKVFREVIIPEKISVGDLANRMTERSSDVIRELMKLGIIARINEHIDADTAEIIVTTFGHTFKRVQESDVENVLLEIKDEEKDLTPRAPVVTIMGHVDHGKTSLLDAIRSTDIAASEAGGITQHIGAYQVTLGNGKKITFIDTPGHEAFSEMRTRGAKVTDIVILVVAADDGIMNQTVEAINHARAANVPIIVAANKIDKQDADSERVKRELLQYELIVEELGGDVMFVEVSALKKINIDKLEEAILLMSEMLELKANYNAQASGVVIESKIDKNKGVVATLLVQRGTIKNSDIIVAGTAYGKIKKITDYKNQEILSACPSDPIEIMGLDEAPISGEHFYVVQNEKQAREITEYRKRLERDKKVSLAPKVTLDEMFSKAKGITNVKELNLVIRADTSGSVEAIVSSLSKIHHEEVRVKVIHSGVGAITESDTILAHASKAIIIGFNVRATTGASNYADKFGVDIRYYSIIYALIDEIKSALEGLLSPNMREQYLGSASIRQVFVISKIGKIAGCYVTKGIIKRGGKIRLIRDNIVIYEGNIKTLRRFKDDVKEVRENFECGIAIENYDDIREGDVLEVFEVISEQKTL